MKKLDKENPDLAKALESFKSSLAGIKDKMKLKKEKAKKCKGKCGGPKKMAKAEDMGEMPETETETESESCCSCDCCEELCDVCDSLTSYCDYCCSRIDNCFNYIFQLEATIWDHMNTGHLPKLTPTQLTALLKAAGADKDYSVQPKILYASKSGFSVELEKK